MLLPKLKDAQHYCINTILSLFAARIENGCTTDEAIEFAYEEVNALAKGEWPEPHLETEYKEYVESEYKNSAEAPLNDSAKGVYHKFTYNIQEDLAVLMEDNSMNTLELAIRIGVSEKKIKKFFSSSKLKLKLATKIAHALGAGISMRIEPLNALSRAILDNGHYLCAWEKDGQEYAVCFSGRTFRIDTKEEIAERMCIETLIEQYPLDAVKIAYLYPQGDQYDNCRL